MNGTPYLFYISSSGKISLYPHIVPYSEFRNLDWQAVSRSRQMFVIHRSGRLYFHTYVQRFEENEKKPGKFSYIGMSMCHNSAYIPEMYALADYYETYYLNSAYLLVRWLRSVRKRCRNMRAKAVADLDIFLAGFKGQYDKKFRRKILNQPGLMPAQGWEYIEPGVDRLIKRQRVIESVRKGENVCLRTGSLCGHINKFPGFRHPDMILKFDDMAELTMYANLGDASAQSLLGSRMVVASCCISLKKRIKYSRAAVRWLERAVEQKEWTACGTLGYCYSTGTGCDAPDMKKAIRLFRKGAGKRVDECCSSLAGCYRRKYIGLGGSLLELFWLARGAVQGEKKAKSLLLDKIRRSPRATT